MIAIGIWKGVTGQINWSRAPPWDNSTNIPYLSQRETAIINVTREINK